MDPAPLVSTFYTLHCIATPGTAMQADSLLYTAEAVTVLSPELVTPEPVRCTENCWR